MSAGSDIAYGLARQRDGKFVLAGFANNGGGKDWGIVRVGPHGRLDPTFGNGGKVVTHFTASYEYAYGVVVQSNGKIVVVGRANQPSGGPEAPDFCIVRYRVGGKLDDTFGVGGRTFTDFGGGEDTARGVAAAVQRPDRGGGGGAVRPGPQDGHRALPVDIARSRAADRAPCSRVLRPLTPPGVRVGESAQVFEPTFNLVSTP